VALSPCVVPFRIPYHRLPVSFLLGAASLYRSRCVYRRSLQAHVSGYVRDTIKRLGLPVVYSKEVGRRAEYRAAAAAGMTYEEAAEHLGVKPNAVRKMSSAYGITFRSKFPYQTAPIKLPAPRPGAFSASPDAIRRYTERAK